MVTLQLGRCSAGAREQATSLGEGSGRKGLDVDGSSAARYHRPISHRLRWPSGTVPDLRSGGRGFDSRQWLLCTNANSACHPFGVG